MANLEIYDSVTFMVISDTHSITPHFTKTLPAVDVVLHCGDLTENGHADQHRNTFELLRSIPAECKLVIAGNHDLSLDAALCERLDAMPFHRKALDIWAGPEAAANGIRYLTEGLHTITLANGASFTIYASPWTPKHGGGWAFQYPISKDRYGASAAHPIPTNTPVDIVMTHGPPKFLMDECANGSNGGCEHLLRALRRSRPLMHCFGHIHEGYGAQMVEWQEKGDETNEHGVEAYQKEWAGKNQMKKNGFLRKDATDIVRGQQTLLVNAAILDAEHAPTNVPWIVELALG